MNIRIRKSADNQFMFLLSDDFFRDVEDYMGQSKRYKRKQSITRILKKFTQFDYGCRNSNDGRFYFVGTSGGKVIITSRMFDSGDEVAKAIEAVQAGIDNVWDETKPGIIL